MRYAAGIIKTATTPTTMPAMAPVARPEDAGAGVALGVMVAVGVRVCITVVCWRTVVGTTSGCDAATIPSLLFPVGPAPTAPVGAAISDGIPPEAGISDGMPACAARRWNAMADCLVFRWKRFLGGVLSSH